MCSLIESSPQPCEAGTVTVLVDARGSAYWAPPPPPIRIKFMREGVLCFVFFSLLYPQKLEKYRFSKYLLNE